MSAPTITLERIQIDTIREALLVGLRALGAIEESANACNNASMAGIKLPDGVMPAHPTECSGAITLFADALMSLELAPSSQPALPKADVTVAKAACSQNASSGEAP